MTQKKAEIIDTIETTKKTTNSEGTKYKTERCKVLLFNKDTKELDIDFQGYGIRIFNVSNVKSDFVIVKYKGKIGTPNFSCGL